MEILLLCIEVAQYQQYIKPQLGDGIQSNVTEIEYENIPNASILETDDDASFILSAKTIANRLYEKYVEEGSEYEINISGTMRDELTDLIGNLDQLISDETVDLDRLYAMFEQSVQEMMTLQNISFERFKQSETFSDVKALLTNQAV